VQNRISSIVAAAWLFALAAFELAHFIRGEPWPGYTLVVNYISFFYIALFLAGCFRLVQYQWNKPLLPFLAFAGAIIHGVVLLAGSAWQGYVHFASGIILMIHGVLSVKSNRARFTTGKILESRRAA
jgi:hypothetical protein